MDGKVDSADSTHNKIKASEFFSQNLGDKYAGSGVAFFLTDLDGEEIASFVLAGDNLGLISESMGIALVNELKVRRAIRQSELNTINKLLAGGGDE